MNILKRFFAFLRRIAGLEEDIEKIMKPISSIVAKLEKHRAEQLAAAEADEAAAARATAKAAREREVAAEASRLADRYAL